MLKSKGVVEGANEDNQIIIPFKTAMRRLFNVQHIKSIYIEVENEKLMDQAESEISDVLRVQHRLDRFNKEDDFTIQNQMNILKARKKTSESFTKLITGVAAISLFVGGIGILVIMIIAVKEITNEIGLRMAVCARPKDILLQFLLEALMLGLSGGFCGLLIGILISLSIGLTTYLPTSISPLSVFLSLIFSLSLGFFFGLYPSRRDSLLDPIEALRAE